MTLDLPLNSAGLQVAVGSIKEAPPAAVGSSKPAERRATGDSLQLPLGTQGLSVGVGIIKA